MFDPMMCETCGCELESDDAVSIIEGICGACRQTASPLIASAPDPEPVVPRPVRIPPKSTAPKSTANVPVKSPQPPAMAQSQRNRPIIPLNSPASLISGTLPPTSCRNHSEANTSHPIPESIPAMEQPSERPPAKEQPIAEKSEEKKVAVEPAPRESSIDSLPAHEQLASEQPFVKQPVEKPTVERTLIKELLDETEQPFCDTTFDTTFDTAHDIAIDPNNVVPTPTPPQEPDWPTEDIPRYVTPTMVWNNPPRKRASRRRWRDLLIGVTAGLIATAFIMHWVISEQDIHSPLVLSSESLSTSTVHLSVQPTWATVSLNGQPIDPPNQFGQLALTLPNEDTALPWIEVSAEGFHTDRRPISVYAGTQDVIVELRRKPYEVAITTEPPDAQVWIDGRLTGLTPTTLTVPAEQTASLTIKANGYKDLVHELTPPEKGAPIELQFTLTQMGPKLFIASDPPGADILVEGTTYGTAPLTIELDSDYLDRDVTVTASLPGHADRNVQVACPHTAHLAPIETMVMLNPLVSEVRFETDPPGGSIILHGKNLGPAPVTMTFDRNEIGEMLVVQATLAGSHHGSKGVTVPPVGEPVSITIPMEFNAQRLVFILKCPSDSLSEGVLLKEELVGQIHGLGPDQRFAVLAGTFDGIRSWPMKLDTKAATREQKVRAYDMVRSVRLGGSASMGDIMRAALIYNPTTICVFVSGDIDKMEFEEYAEWAENRTVSIHVVRASSTPEDDWLAGWVADRQGTLSILGETSTPSLAMDKDVVD